MTHTDTPLLPCPFCGGPAELKYFNHAMVWYAQCADWQCGSKTHSDNPALVAEAWNRRADAAGSGK